MSENKTRLITNDDICDEKNFSSFRSDKDRIKYISKEYKSMSIVDAFKTFYHEDISETLSNKHSVANHIYSLVPGNIYNGTVETFNKRAMTFSLPGVKDEIICKENLWSCNENIENYLLNHDNKLLFEVREKENNVYNVSVISAYYKKWENSVNDAIWKNNGIQVHIDELVNGGYMCHTHIKPLVDLTGRLYTHSVFIPGSHIVLNIENDFEKWVGQEVIIVPQKFVDFKKNFKTGEVERSLVGSRKKVLQILGNNNLHEYYNKYNLIKDNPNVKWDNNEFDGIVTGIINSQKKTGIFIELKDKYITGLAQLDVIDLINYKPGDEVKVRISEFEIKEGCEPFTYTKNGAIKECNIRPVFELI